MTMSNEVEESKQTVYKQYDPKFTEDISKRMQMPDRLVPGNEHDTRMFDYNFRERVFNNPLSDHPLEEARYILSTPPNSLKNYPGTTLADNDDDDDDDDDFYKHTQDKSWKGLPNGFRFEDEKDDDPALLMTPGTMLLMKDGNNLAALQRQVAKLARRVTRLQEENSRRNNRDLIIYPLFISFVLLQLGRYIFSR